MGQACVPAHVSLMGLSQDGPEVLFHSWATGSKWAGPGQGAQQLQPGQTPGAGRRPRPRRGPCTFPASSLGGGENPKRSPKAAANLSGCPQLDTRGFWGGCWALLCSLGPKTQGVLATCGLLPAMLMQFVPAAPGAWGAVRLGSCVPGGSPRCPWPLVPGPWRLGSCVPGGSPCCPWPLVPGTWGVVCLGGVRAARGPWSLAPGERCAWGESLLGRHCGQRISFPQLCGHLRTGPGLQQLRPAAQPAHERRSCLPRHHPGKWAQGRTAETWGDPWPRVAAPFLLPGPSTCPRYSGPLQRCCPTWTGLSYPPQTRPDCAEGAGRVVLLGLQ